MKNTSTVDLRLVSSDAWSGDSAWFDIGIVHAGEIWPAVNSDVLTQSQVGG
jgi:hypothetical protein